VRITTRIRKLLIRSNALGMNPNKGVFLPEMIAKTSCLFLYSQIIIIIITILQEKITQLNL